MSTTPTALLETTAAALETTLATVGTSVTEATEATESLLDIASIKEMMDGFDPAALLPELSSVFGSLSTVCRWAVIIGPVVLLALGLAYLFLSPKEANWYFGYHCYFGMGSIHAWRFTQRFAGLIFSLVGLGLCLVMFPICASFSGMEVGEMVWKALDCLIWEAVLTVAARVLINLAAFACFDRKGEYRRKKRRPKA